MEKINGAEYAELFVNMVLSRVQLSRESLLSENGVPYKIEIPEKEIFNEVIFAEIRVFDKTVEIMDCHAYINIKFTMLILYSTLRNENECYHLHVHQFAYTNTISMPQIEKNHPVDSAVVTLDNPEFSFKIASNKKFIEVCAYGTVNCRILTRAVIQPILNRAGQKDSPFPEKANAEGKLSLQTRHYRMRKASPDGVATKSQGEERVRYLSKLNLYKEENLKLREENLSCSALNKSLQEANAKQQVQIQQLKEACEKQKQLAHNLAKELQESKKIIISLLEKIRSLRKGIVSSNH